MSLAPTLQMPPSTDACPLSELAAESIAMVERGERAQVIFDLDDTLFLVHPRKRVIFRELADTHEEGDPTREALWRLSMMDIPYDVKEALGNVGIHHEPVVKRLIGDFFARFFDGAYTQHDAAHTGAAEYLNHLHAHGVDLVYLSGRPEEMLERTIDTLVANDFPLDVANPAVILKGRHELHLGDAEFKGIKGHEIARAGAVTAAFDNEPANLNAMYPAMPNARFFLLDTDHSPNPPALEMPNIVLKDFGRSRTRLQASLAASPRFMGGGWTMQVQANQ